MGHHSRQFFAPKMWALNASGPFIGAHLKSLMEYPPSQGADTLSIKKALDEMQQKAGERHGRRLPHVSG